MKTKPNFPQEIPFQKKGRGKHQAVSEKKEEERPFNSKPH